MTARSEILGFRLPARVTIEKAKVEGVEGVWSVDKLAFKHPHERMSLEKVIAKW